MKKIAVFIILLTTTFSLNAQTYQVFKMEEYVECGNYGYLQLIKELEFSGNENTIIVDEDGFRTQGPIFKKNQYYYAYDSKVLDDELRIVSITFKYNDNGVKHSGDWVQFYFPISYAYAVLTLHREIALYEETVEGVTKYYVKELRQ